MSAKYSTTRTEQSDGHEGETHHAATAVGGPEGRGQSLPRQVGDSIVGKSGNHHPDDAAQHRGEGPHQEGEGRVGRLEPLDKAEDHEEHEHHEDEADQILLPEELAGALS